jgi:hypothetical protein
MQDRPDGKLDGIVSTPVNSELDLLLGAAFRASQRGFLRFLAGQGKLA